MRRYRPATSSTVLAADSVTRAGTDSTSHAAAAIAAFERFTRPGSASSTAIRSPRGVVTASAQVLQVGVGRARPQAAQDHCGHGVDHGAWQRGHSGTSTPRRPPVATQRTPDPSGRARSTAVHTRGSSAFATTVAVGAAVSAVDHRVTWADTSPPRSSWSRLRLSSTTTTADASSARISAGSASSSTSSTAGQVRGDVLASSALATPDMRLAPESFVTTRCPARRPAATKRVVVVLPLVPDTITTGRARVRRPISAGSSRSATRPGRVVPLPRRAALDIAAVTRPARTAALERGGNRQGLAHRPLQPAPVTSRAWPHAAERPLSTRSVIGVADTAPGSSRLVNRSAGNGPRPEQPAGADPTCRSRRARPSRTPPPTAEPAHR